MVPGSIPGVRIWHLFAACSCIGDIAVEVRSSSFVGLVVMTLALHARGPQFNPGTEYLFYYRGSIAIASLLASITFARTSFIG